MNRAVGAVSFVSVVAISGAAFAATTLRSTWSAPDAQPGTFRGKKVVTLFVSPDEQERRGVEGLLADELTKRGAQGVPAVALIPAEEIRDEAKVRPRLAAAEVRGAVVFRLVAEDRKLGHLGADYGNKTYASLWGGHWGVGWDGVYAPGDLTPRETSTSRCWCTASTRTSSSGRARAAPPTPGAQPNSSETSSRRWRPT